MRGACQFLCCDKVRGMENLPVILGVSGTAGVLLGMVCYVLARGVQSKCRFNGIEITFNVQKEGPSQANKYDMKVGDISVRQLEDILDDILHPRSRRDSHSHSMRELEDFIKDTIIHSSKHSPITRSRSGSVEKQTHATSAANSVSQTNLPHVHAPK